MDDLARGGNRGVYNVLDFGVSPTNTDNTTTLYNALFAIAQAGGGLVLIPPGLFKFAGTITMDGSASQNPFPDASLIIAGYGSKTELIQTGTNDTFSINALSSGIRFQDIQISYGGGGAAGNAAIRVSQSQNVTCSRVFFADCPTAMYLGNKAVHSGLLDCTIEYARGPNNATAVVMGGSENYVASCVFRQGVNGNPPGPDAPTGCTAILIAPKGGGIYVTDTQLSDFDIALLIAGSDSNNLTHACISNVHCESGVNAVLIQPPAGAAIYQVSFANCVFARIPGAVKVNSGVLVDATKGGIISDVFFNNCMSHDWTGAGLEINGGQDIVIAGGRYGSNASDPSQATSGGIAVTGPAVRVSVIGADCSGSIPRYASQPQVPPITPQPYGISVTGAVVDMQVRSCNLNNCKTGPLYATLGSDLRMADCDGYNDQGRVLQSAPPPPTGSFTNKHPWTNAPQGWFGPIAFYVTGVEVFIDGVDTGLTGGAFTLAPGESASVTGETGHFLVIGK